MVTEPAVQALLWVFASMGDDGIDWSMGSHVSGPIYLQVRRPAAPQRDLQDISKARVLTFPQFAYDAPAEV